MKRVAYEILGKGKQKINLIGWLTLRKNRGQDWLSYNKEKGRNFMIKKHSILKAVTKAQNEHLKYIYIYKLSIKV